MSKFTIDNKTKEVEIPHFIVPTPLEGGGTIYSNGFFSDNFRRSIYFSQRVESAIIRSSYSVEYGIKDFFSFFTGSYRGLNF